MIFDIATSWAYIVPKIVDDFDDGLTSCEFKVDASVVYEYEGFPDLASVLFWVFVEYD